MWKNGEVVLLEKWIGSLPEGSIARRPKLGIYFGWGFLTAGKPDLLEKWLETSHNAIRGLDDSKGKSDLQGRLASLKSVAATFSGRHGDTARWAEKALELLAEDNTTWRSVAAMSLGDAKAFLGGMREADEAYAAAIDQSRKAGNVYMGLLTGFKRITIRVQLGLLYPALELCDELIPRFEKYGMIDSAVAGCVFSFKGSILGEFGRLDEGMVLLQKGVGITDEDSPIGMKGWCCLNLIRGLLRRGESERVQTLLTKLTGLSRETTLPPWIAAPLDVVRTASWLIAGDLDAVEGWIRRNEFDKEEIRIGFADAPAYMTAARYYLLKNNYRKVDHILDCVFPPLKTDGRIAQLMEVLIFRAMNSYQSGRTDHALSSLKEALVLGEECGFLMVFRDCGIPVPLLESALKQNMLPEYTGKIIDLVEKSQPRQSEIGFRFFGESGGEPRQLIWMPHQLEDLEAAIQYARGLEVVDPAKIALWGTSAGGGHVVTTVARDNKIACVSAMVPMLDGSASADNPQEEESGWLSFRMFLHGQRDMLRSRFGLPAHRIPIVGKPGTIGLMTTADAYEAFVELLPDSYVNQACARIILRGGFYRPVETAQDIQCPVLLQISENDSLIPMSASEETIRKLGDLVEVRTYSVGHFEIYTGKSFERSVGEQIDFFKKHL
ncbi:MAG: prolyl oligopeptidase family serine peptidase [Proteobacteria bacterium]|nr:prolyl oligopeptidase family serine peptidase [Pseudomonadota bacterium]